MARDARWLEAQNKLLTIKISILEKNLKIEEERATHYRDEWQKLALAKWAEDNLER